MPSPLAEPATGGAAITPSDSADLTVISRGVYVGTSGDLKVDMADGTALTFNSLAAGVIHPLRVRRIYSTGTTALNIKTVF